MIELQRKLMGDAVRNAAFAEALKRVIVPGKSIVADLGAGTGFLSFVAEQLGAKKCHLYEFGGALKLSKQLAKENGMKRCTFVHQHSTAVEKPVQADVVVSETLGNFPYEEHILETMQDAKRFLKPGGVLIPQRLRCDVCPVVTERLWKEINVWDTVGHGLTFAAAKELTLNNMYVRTVRPEELLPGGVQSWDEVDFMEEELASVRESEVTWAIAAPVTVFGFALWWEATLVDGVTLSTSPLSPPTHWEQVFLPLLSPLVLERGESLELTLTSDTRWKVGVNVTWDVRLKASNGRTREHQSLDMKKGWME